MCDDIFFSISHSFDLHTIIFSQQEIGIDIEKIRDYNSILLKSLSFDEVKNLNNKDDFWVYWTLKESFIKYQGIYLNENINKISFNILDKDNIKCYYNGTEQKLFFKVLNINDYIISICSKTEIKNLNFF